MLDLVMTTQFHRDLKRIRKRGIDVAPLEVVLLALRRERPLAAKYRDHALTGDYIGFRECHVAPDWLLIYAVDRDQLILTALRTGSHAALF